MENKGSGLSGETFSVWRGPDAEETKEGCRGENMEREKPGERELQVLLVCCLVLSLASSAVAGEWGLFVGAGGGNCESVTGDVSLQHRFEPLYESSGLMLYPAVELSVHVWRHSSDEETLGGTLAGGFVLVFPREGAWRPYVSATLGGSFLSDDDFGSHDLGGIFQFRSKGALGIQFGRDYRHSIQVDAAHFSNAGFHDRNSGFNMFGCSYGFRF